MVVHRQLYRRSPFQSAVLQWCSCESNTPFVLPMLCVRFTAPPPALLKASTQTVGLTALPHSSFKHHDACRLLSWCSPLIAVCLLIGACTATASNQRQRQAMVMAY